jgi:ubiquitin carboxyl-terminal hydrolase 36/42
MNSVLQCLAYSPGLPFFAEHIPNIIYDAAVGHACFLHHFGELCRAMRALSSVPPQVFFANLAMICPGMKSGQQEDAHEFLLSLLNLFDHECERAFGPSHEKFDTAVHAIFGGRLSEVRECQKCGTTLKTESRFLDVTLPLERGTIEECFEKMLLGQDQSECFCQKCKKQSSFSNRSVFLETPQVLIVMMMRFTRQGVKIEKAVDFGFDLDLSTVVDQGVHAAFDLFGMVIHNGHQLNHGHFLSYVRCETGVWYSADDSRVSKISSRVVRLARPYILFYKRKIPSVPLAPVIVTFGLDDDEDTDE